MVDGGYQSGDRRPIAARELTFFKRLAHRLAARRVSANAISIAGMIAGLAAGAALAATPHVPTGARLLWILAAGCVQLRLLANMLDGMVAVETQTASPLGELFNEVPDRISDGAALVGLGYAVGGSPELGYIAALAAVFTAYVRAIGKVAGAPQDFSGPMAKQQRMFLVTVVSLFCGLAPRDWQPVWNRNPEFGLPAVVLSIIVLGCLWTALRRLRNTAAALTRGGK